MGLLHLPLPQDYGHGHYGSAAIYLQFLLGAGRFYVQTALYVVSGVSCYVVLQDQRQGLPSRHRGDGTKGHHLRQRNHKQALQRPDLLRDRLPR